MADSDAQVDRFDSHVTKLFDRLDNAYMNIELKEYCGALAIARQLVMSLIAMRKETAADATGATTRKYEAAFKDAASRGADDSRSP